MTTVECGTYSLHPEKSSVATFDACIRRNLETLTYLSTGKYNKQGQALRLRLDAMYRRT